MLRAVAWRLRRSRYSFARRRAERRTLAALERATGRTLHPDERWQFMEVQQQANRWTYIGSGMSHPKFIEMMGMLSKDRQRELLDAVPMFS